MAETDKTRSKKRLAIYLAGLFVSFHYVLVVYVNSSFLKQFWNTDKISILYTIGSIISIILFVKASQILNKIGNLKTIVVLIILELIATLGIASINNPSFLLAFFLIHQSVIPLIFFCLDIFLEHEQKYEAGTGRSRGIFLTFQNIAWIGAPLMAGFIGINFGLPKIYLVSSFFIFPLLINLVINFRDYKDKPIPKVKLLDTWRSLKEKVDIKRILLGNTLLQLFYTIMVIYLPILLYETAKFEWNSIGAILTIMLLPFLFLELPLGYLSDKIGEKEIIYFGFIIMSVFTLGIFFIQSSSFIVWALVLFATRVGASSIEVSNESYFFKHVKDRDANVISLFRMTRPISYILAPFFAIPILLFTSYSGLFATLGILTLAGLLFVPKIDTR